MKRSKLADRWPGILTTLVACAGMAILVGAVRDSRRSGIRGERVHDYVSLLSYGAKDGLPEKLAPVWLHSVADDDHRSARARAVRIGALAADLKIEGIARNRLGRSAYYGHDSAAIEGVKVRSRTVASFAHQLAGMLDDVPGGARGAGFYRLLEQEGIDRATVDPSVRDSALAASLGYRPEWVRLGNWLEVVRVAALRRDRAFLLRSECADEAEAALTLPGLSDEERVALEKIHAVIMEQPDGDLMAVEGAATHALSLLANG